MKTIFIVVRFILFTPIILFLRWVNRENHGDNDNQPDVRTRHDR